MNLSFFFSLVVILRTESVSIERRSPTTMFVVVALVMDGGKVAILSSRAALNKKYSTVGCWRVCAVSWNYYKVNCTKNCEPTLAQALGGYQNFWPLTKSNGTKNMVGGFRFATPLNSCCHDPHLGAPPIGRQIWRSFVPPFGFKWSGKFLAVEWKSTLSIACAASSRERRENTPWTSRWLIPFPYPSS